MGRVFAHGRSRPIWAGLAPIARSRLSQLHHPLQAHHLRHDAHHLLHALDHRRLVRGRLCHLRLYLRPLCGLVRDTQPEAQSGHERRGETHRDLRGARGLGCSRPGGSQFVVLLLGFGRAGYFGRPHDFQSIRRIPTRSSESGCVARSCEKSTSHPGSPASIGCRPFIAPRPRYTIGAVRKATDSRTRAVRRGPRGSSFNCRWIST